MARRATNPERIEKAMRWLGDRGWETALEHTTASMQARELAAEAARLGYDVVAACGGDGTVNEVANGLAMTNTALAVVPAGTANVWAKEIRVPHNPMKAVKIIDSGERRRMDLGLLCARNDSEELERYFLLMAGVGLDAHVIQEVDGEVKRRWGAAAYLWQGIGNVFKYRESPAHLKLDEQPMETGASWVVAGNTRLYGGVIEITHEARADDGLLDICLFSRSGAMRALSYWLRVLFRRPHGGDMLYTRARCLTFEDAGLPVQADGDYVGETPATMQSVPDALTVIVPKGLKSPLFSKM